MAQRKKRISSTVDWATLKGKYFHTFDKDGYVQNQGQIVDLIEDDIAIVLYFERTGGSPAYHRAVWVSDVIDEGWALYNTDVAWRDAIPSKLVKTRS